ncbi:MAG: helix-turn-helix domain-containing protein [Treponema sp.]|nr:helix-turn-helix domain-containing protein [Treponema sp.]
MKESIEKRITVLRNELGLTKAKFAERIGVTGQFVSMLESGKSKLTEANIRLTCLTFGVNEEWLREGTGEMLDEDAQLSDHERQLLAFFEELTPLAQKFLIEYAQKLVSDEQALRGEAPHREHRNISLIDDFPDEQAGEKAPHPIHDLERA